VTEEYDLKFHEVFSLEHRLREDIQRTIDKARSLPSTRATIGDYLGAIASPAHQQQVEVLATFGRLTRDLEKLRDNKRLLMQDHEYNDAVSHLRYIRDLIEWCNAEAPKRIAALDQGCKDTERGIRENARNLLVALTQSRRKEYRTCRPDGGYPLDIL